MPVSFNRIPSNIRVPLVWQEVDPSRAGTTVIADKAGMTGQMLSTGTAIADTPVRVSDADEARELFGQGSMLARQVAAFRKANSFQELWCVPVAEPGAGVAATGNIAVTAPATAPGTLTLYIAGQRVQVAVASGDVATDIAAALEAAINADLELPVTAAATLADVALTCRWKGETGNDITVVPNVYGKLGGEVYPAGVSVTVTPMAGGTGAPDLSAAFASLGDEAYDSFCLPFTDTVSLDAFRDEWTGSVDGGRWSWDRQLFGIGWSAHRGTQSALGTFGNARNDPHISIGSVEVAVPTPVWEIAAVRCAQAARALMNDPARPLQTLPLPGVIAPPVEDRFTLQERNTLLYDGLSTHSWGDDGTCYIERAITTYQKNAYGFDDNAFLDVTTLATLAFILRSMRQRITSRYPRHKLANDGTAFGPGQAIVTPNIIKAELVAHYRELEYSGLVENVAAFKANLIVERNAADPNRVDVLYPPDLINQLRVFAVLAQFRLQYSDADSQVA